MKLSNRDPKFNKVFKDKSVERIRQQFNKSGVISERGVARRPARVVRCQEGSGTEPCGRERSKGKVASCAWAEQRRPERLVERAPRGPCAARNAMPRGSGLALRAQLDGKGCKPGCLCCPVLVRPMINRCVTSTGCDVPEGAKLPDDDGT